MQSVVAGATDFLGENCARAARLARFEHAESLICRVGASFSGVRITWDDWITACE